MTNRCTILLLIGLISLAYRGYSQTTSSPSDSLREKLRVAVHDSSRMKALHALTRHFVDRETYDSAMHYCTQAIALAEQTGNKMGLADALSNRGNIGSDQEKYPQAIEDWQAALRIYQSLGEKKKAADTYNLIANGFHRLQDYPNALKNQYAALTLREEIHDEQGIAWSYNNIATVYRIQGDYPEALKNYFHSMELLEKQGDQAMVALSLNNIGNVYTLQRKYGDALHSYTSALRIRQSLGKKDDIAASYLNIGDALCDLFEKDSTTREIRMDLGGLHPETIPRANWLDKAMQIQTSAHAINMDEGNDFYQIYSLSGLGRIHFLKKQYYESIRFYAKAYALANTMHALELQKEIAQYLADNYGLVKDYRNGLYWHIKFTEHKDSLFSQLKSEDLARTRLKYEFDKRENAARALQDKKDALAQAELARQKKMRNLLLGGLGIVLLFAATFFYQRNNIKKEKMRSDELLLNILPEEVAEELKEKGRAEAKHFEEVTVMFTDFKGFTQISEQLSPAELVAEIDECFKAFDEIITQHNLEKIKTIGDAYMAAGGLPVTNTTHARDVTVAAIHIQRFMQEHLQQRKKNGEPLFELRIGIHTGPVVAGIVGLKKFAYDIWGDTVNIASRMESSGEAGRINISSRTYELVKDEFRCVHRGRIQAKNKGEIDMYFVDTIQVQHEVNL